MAPVTIEAGNETDALRALGFVHGLLRPWHVLHARQIALGRLGTWFGTPALTLDSLALRLGLAEQARAAFQTLPEADRERLRAYTEGLNAALATETARLSRPFVLLSVPVAPWEPWHPLALERLYAWLAVAPPAPDVLAHLGPEAHTFFQSDRRLRSWLQLNGFEHSVAWTVTDSTGARTSCSDTSTGPRSGRCSSRSSCA
ncbi:MAG: hypothetical protein KatS3mg044_1162 [Rhodothermaceae bacterium]|nr:MAG: hypothetical protein KatS3mg044_1162 [Rhodothermaceae bacterium]